MIDCQLAAIAQQNTWNLMPVPKQLAVNTGRTVLAINYYIGTRQCHRYSLYKAVNRAYQALNRKTGWVLASSILHLQIKMIRHRWW